MKQSAVFRLGLLALIWGSSFLWIKLADRGFAPVDVTFARLALGAAALFPVVAVRREALPRSAALWAQIATVTYLLPVVAIVLGVLVLGETVTITVLAGIALVLAGVALTRRRDRKTTVAGPPAGDTGGALS